VDKVEKAVSNDQITKALYGWSHDVDSNTIQVHIHNLRKKLGCKNIHTVRGVGYMLKKVI
jgi:two-component system response regulator QseB